MRSFSVRYECLVVVVCSTVFLSLVLVDSEFVFIQSEGIFNDQYMAAMLVEQWRGGDDSFWRAFVEGRLPTGRYGAPHHGTLFAYLYIPFYWLFGGSWFVARTRSRVFFCHWC